MTPEDENVVFLAVATLVCCIAAFVLVVLLQRLPAIIGWIAG